MNYTDIKTLEDSFKYLNVESFNIQSDNTQRKELIAYENLKIVIKALNEAWASSCKTNTEIQECHISICFFAINRWYTYTNKESKLTYKSQEIAVYAANQFSELYYDYQGIKKIN